MLNKMIEFDSTQIESIPKRERAHLINNLCGLRSANLIGTSDGSEDNLAIFNSVIHLGSNPPLLGIVFRPLTVERHTYNNIKETKYFSINQITRTMTANAHHTSAKFEYQQSEFEFCGIKSLHRKGCVVPYVKESNIQILCTYSREHMLENDCILLTATIERFWVNSDSINKSHWLNHEKATSTAIGGLDAYYQVSLIDRYNYAQPDTAPKSILD
jgi:flavin reductase (DIM6/NTAB) family NADH-FMN oxidoreductase RutF